MVGAWRRRGHGRLSHEQQQQGHRQAHPQHELEIIHIGDAQGLARDLVVERREPGRGCAVPDHIRAPRLQHAVERRDALRDRGMHGLRVLGQEERSDGDADGAADVADQGEQGRPVRAQLGRQRREGDHLQRNEDEAQPEALHRRGDRQRPGGDVGRPARHLPKAAGKERDTDEHQQAGIDPSRQPPRHHHRNHGADAARRHQEARRAHRIAGEILQIGGEQRRARQQHHADREHHQKA